MCSSFQCVSTCVCMCVCMMWVCQDSVCAGVADDAGHHVQAAHLPRGGQEPGGHSALLQQLLQWHTPTGLRGRLRTTLRPFAGVWEKKSHSNIFLSISCRLVYQDIGSSACCTGNLKKIYIYELQASAFSRSLSTDAECVMVADHLPLISFLPC